LENSNFQVSEPGAKGNRLEICTLGRFSVKKDDVLLSAVTGRLSKQWELFMYLLAHKEKLSPVEDIQDALWPEDEFTDPGKNLKNQVHRLRKKIDDAPITNNDSTVVYSNGCYSWNRATSYWLDAEVFEALCTEARSLADKDPAEAASKYREAISLYRGDFLPEFAQPEWVLPVRHYYRQLFLRSVLELLDLCMERKEYSEVAKICEKTFLIEKYDEDLHQRYIEALLEEGKTAQARAQYQYITALLYREFGAKPSSEMQRLYRLIKAKIGGIDLDFTDIRELLIEYQAADGALFCDADSFELICRLEKRRAKRANKPVSVATITLTGPDFRMPPPLELQEAMKSLEQVLLNNLRHGDVFSHWNESQFVVLLVDVDVKRAEVILQRIKDQFSKAFSKDIVIPRSSFHPLPLPKKS